VASPTIIGPSDGDAAVLCEQSGGTARTCTPAVPGTSCFRTIAGRFWRISIKTTTSAQDGIDAWLANQFDMAGTQIGLPSQASTVASDTLHRMATAPDLTTAENGLGSGQFIVISMTRTSTRTSMFPTSKS